MSNRKIAGSKNANSSIAAITIGKLYKRPARETNIAKCVDTKARFINYLLIQVDGLPRQIASYKMLSSKNYFGKYGTISNLYINDTSTLKSSKLSTVQVYVTYKTQLSASLALLGIEGIQIHGNSLLGSFGTNRYCQSLIFQQQCKKINCFYLHEYDAENDALKPINAKENHKNRAISCVTKNIKLAIAMEMEEKNNKGASNSPFYDIGDILRNLIDSKSLSVEEYEMIKKKGKFVCQKFVKLRSSPTFSVPEEPNQQNQTSRLSICSTTQSLHSDSEGQQKSIGSSHNQTQSDEFSEMEANNFLEDMIKTKLLAELGKKRKYSRLDFAKPYQKPGQLTYVLEDEQINSVQEAILTYLKEC